MHQLLIRIKYIFQIFNNIKQTTFITSNTTHVYFYSNVYSYMIATCFGM